MQQVIALIPVKNYSDYEIPIEAKEIYEDALYSSESELEDALLQPVQRIKEANKTKTHKQPTAKIAIDFESLLPEKSIDHLDDDHQQNKVGKLTVIANTINHSPARKILAVESNAKAFNEQLAGIQKNIEQQALAQQPIATSKINQPQNHTDSQAKTSTFTNITSRIKEKGKQLTDIGIAQMDKSKAELEEYFGRSLPERKLSLDFILPTSKNNKEHTSRLTERDIEKRFSLKKPLASLLDKAEQDLGSLAKTAMANGRRLSLLDSYTPPLAEKLQSLIVMYQRKPSAHDDKSRCALIDSAMTVIKHLISGYKQIYLDIYQSTNVIYGPQRKTANQVAFRLLDCLYLEQQLTIGLHIDTPGSSIKTVNKLYFALSLYENKQLKAPRKSLATNNTTNISDLYCAYQANLVIDFNSLSSSSHRLAHSYLQKQYSLLSSIPIQQSQRLTSFNAGQQLWEIKHDLNTPPLLLTSNDEVKQAAGEFKPAFIQVQSFFNKIKNDYVQALKCRMSQKPHHPDPALKESPLAQSLFMLSVLNRSVRNFETTTNTPSFTIFNPISLKAYSGLQQTIAYSEYYFQLHHKGFIQQDGNIQDTSNKPIGSKCQWHCAQDDQQLLYLEATEHKIEIPVDVGQLMLFVRPNPELKNTDSETVESELENDEQLILAVITRLQRLPQGKIQINAEIISREWAHIRIDTDKQNSWPALLAKSGQQSIMLCPHAYLNWSNKYSAIRLPDQVRASVNTEGLIALSTELQIYRLQ
ncbi:MAG: hypothetical protein ACJAYG_002549 [Oceanicoccus sp.]